MKENLKKLKVIILLFTASAFVTACGSGTHELRKGPTVTPAPTVSSDGKASDGTADEEGLGVSDEEIVTIIKTALGRMRNEYAEKLDYNAGNEKNAELRKYDDGSSDVIVLDDDGNETARLMYNEKHEMTRAVFNTYKDGKTVSGAVYLGENLASYFENSEVNGFFRLEIEKNDNGYVANVSIGKGKTKNYVFNGDGELLKTE